MASVRSFMKGTFRLSIAVAVLATIYGFYEQWSLFSEAQDGNYKLVTTLECGSRLPETTLKSAVNQAGLIDLGKVGCADRQFFASFSEIEQARTGTTRREWLNLNFSTGYATSYSIAYAVTALLIVNLFGLALVAIRAVFNWIAAGYKSAP